MKKGLCFLLLAALSLHAWAQFAKTVELLAPGTLIDKISVTERDSLNKLTVSGIMDARDFRFIRDLLPFMESVDLGDVSIQAYSGIEGTVAQITDYPEGEIPQYAFCPVVDGFDRSMLKSVVLPKTANSIGESAFGLCSGIDRVKIPASVKQIESMAFIGCSGVFEVDSTNTEYASQDGLLYNKAVTKLLHCPISLKDNCFLPNTVDSIGEFAFYSCTKIKLLDIPYSVVWIGNYAFLNCSGLESVSTNNAASSIYLGEQVFYLSTIRNAILYVPVGQKDMYSMRAQWSEFGAIDENVKGIYIANQTVYATNERQTVRIPFFSRESWTIESGSSWVVPDKLSGKGNDTVSLTLDVNTTNGNRTAYVTFWVTGMEINVKIMQAGPAKMVTTTAGGLSAILLPMEQDSIMSLKVSGTIDARDLKYLKNMKVLTSLDLSETSISEYYGPDGTFTTNYQYAANEIPAFSMGGAGTKDNSTLTNFKLPNGLRSIETFALSNLQALKEITIPDSVTFIGNFAFDECIHLSTLRLGKSLKTISFSAFGSCSKLKDIYLPTDVPVTLGQWDRIFDQVDKSTCVLHVPYGMKQVYVADDQWNDFSTIVENDYGFYTTASKAKLRMEAGSTTKVMLISNVPWTIQSNQSWLQVNPNSGTASDSILLTAEQNADIAVRSATLTFSSPGMDSKTILVQQAATPMSIQISAGGLATCLSIEKLHTLSNLILSGTMDIRDFFFMRDSMTMLAHLDLSAATVVAFSGYNGMNGQYLNNDANVIPDYAFYYFYEQKGNQYLESIVLPRTVNRIGMYVFQLCKALTEVIFPNTLKRIDWEAFESSGITKLVLPNSLTYTGDCVFRYCNKLTDVVMGDSLLAMSNHLFQSCTSLKNIRLSPKLESFGSGVFENCSSLSEISIPNSVGTLSSNLFYGCTSLSKVTFNKHLDAIFTEAFYNCSSLTSINLPQSVEYIGDLAFGSCTGLKTVRVNNRNPKPFSIYDNTFNELNKDSCVLIVPYHTKSLYAALEYWNDFTNMVEYPFNLVLDKDSIQMDEFADSSSMVHVTTNTAWSARSNQPWITVKANSGSGDTAVRLYLEVNTSSAPRSATLTFEVDGVEDQTVEVLQLGAMKHVTVSAGGLASALTTEDFVQLTRLKISGNIDARDFKTMWKLAPHLNELDIREATISAYSGTSGTDVNNGYNYPANTIPTYAFFEKWIYNCGLKRILLPNNLASIGADAFQYCYHLDNLILPNSVTTIEDGAFYRCTGLTSITLGSNLAKIGASVFMDCTGLKDIQFPEALTSIGDYAFQNCSALQTLKLPSKLNRIGSQAFNCSSLTELHATATKPYIFSSLYTFMSVNKATCILYVPTGTKALYAAAQQWNEFTNIVEEGTALKPVSKFKYTIYPNPVNEGFRIGCLTEEVEVTVFDMNGVLLFTKKVVNDAFISTRGLPRGTYVVRIITSKGTFIQKISKIN